MHIASKTVLALALLAGTALAEERGPGTLLVLNKTDDTVSFVDLETRRTLATLPTGAGPHEVATSPDGRLAVVGNYGSNVPGRSLSVYDVGKRELLRKIDLGEFRRPHGIEFEDERHVLVTVEQNRAVIRVDVLDGRVMDVMTTDQGGSHMLVIAPDRSRVYTANIGSGSVSVIDLLSGSLVKVIPTGTQAEGIDITPDGREVWVTNRAADTVSVIDTAKLAVVHELPCASFPIRVKITPDGEHALVSNPNSGDVAVFHVPTHMEVRRIPMELTQAEGADEGLFGSDFGGSPAPIGILVDPSGERAWVANTMANAVTVLDLESWQVVGRIAAGREPDGLGWTPYPAEPKGEQPLRVGILVVDGVYNTELTAPMDIFQHTIFHTEPGMEVFLVAETREPIKSFEGLRILPDFDFATCPDIDVLVVPSAEHSMDTDLENERLIAFVRERGEAADHVLSLCDGAFVLAEAGLLDGLAATTFPSDIPRFREKFGTRIDVREGVSFVHDGKAITSVGGMPSFEAALYLCERLYGAKTARGIAGGLVIDWDLESIDHAKE